MYVFVLGRQPEIGIAELRAVFGEAHLVLPQLATASPDQSPDINRLGGTRKVGRIIHDVAAVHDYLPFLLEWLAALPPGKITLGISHYGTKISAASANQTAKYLKSHLGRSVRMLPNTAAEISDAASLGNRLGSRPTKVELLIINTAQRLIIAELIGVQDLNSYTRRDRGRPHRDARVGMLPPKLAQIMINLAAPAPKSTVLDPFCGTGVVLQEALLAGFDAAGSDIDPRMVKYTQANLIWAQKYLSVKSTLRYLELGDATDHKWPLPINAVVSETYLGQPYSTAPPADKFRANVNTCNVIITKFLDNIAPQLAPNTPLCLAVPCWHMNNKIVHLPITRAIPHTFRSISPSAQPLIYRRPDQIVGRELLVLQRADKSAKI
jgi:tRNA (guanine10-N2)-dimethyltransferase